MSLPLCKIIFSWIYLLSRVNLGVLLAVGGSCSQPAKLLHILSVFYFHDIYLTFLPLLSSESSLRPHLFYSLSSSWVILSTQGPFADIRSNQVSIDQLDHMLDKGIFKDYHLRVEKVYTMKRTYTWSLFPMVPSHDCFTFCSWWVEVVKGRPLEFTSPILALFPSHLH